VSRRAGPGILQWDGRSLISPGSLRGVGAVFHLAGEPIAGGRWNEARKERIRSSRVAGTRALVESIANMEDKPRVLVCASAVGYYGSRGDEILAEDATEGDDFLAQVCVAWEREARAAERHGVRVVSLRLGIVLAKEGGALGKLLPLFRSGLGGPLGEGRQWMPWIHVDDVVGLFLHAARYEALHGPVNAVAPEEVTNETFTRELARAVHRPAFLRVPKLAVRMALGEAATAVFASQRAVPKIALASGYTFRYPTLRAALEDVTSS
jgi:uncharacterized protein (TIGR01777 family)